MGKWCKERRDLDIKTAEMLSLEKYPSYFEKVNLINSERCLQILEEPSPGLSLGMGRCAERLPSDKCCYMSRL